MGKEQFNKEKLNPKNATGIILAGGRSSRMGENKAFLKIKEDKMIDSIVKLFNEIFYETIVVTKQPELYNYLDAKVITDIIPKRGPLCGIHAGLSTAKTEYSFIVPCDMPFLKSQLIELVVSESPGYEVVVPQIDNYLQPLHAVYSKKCIKPIENCLEQDVFKIIAFYPWVKINFLGENKLNLICNQEELNKVFFNVNTKHDLERARKLK